MNREQIIAQITQVARGNLYNSALGHKAKIKVNK